MQGWIKIHRKILEKGYYFESEYIHLWVHLLLMASHKESEFLFNNKIHKLKVGQLITGRNKLSKQTGINASKIERILKCFESEHQIEQQANNRNRLITILSWDKYQISEQQNEQPVNTYNNGKNGNKEYSKVEDFKKPPTKPINKNLKNIKGKITDIPINNLLLSKFIPITKKEDPDKLYGHYRLARWAYDEFIKRHDNWTHLPKAKVQGWAEEIRLTITVDNVSPEDYVKYFTFALDAYKWKNNMQSVDHFRRNYSKITGSYDDQQDYLKRQQNKGNTTPESISLPGGVINEDLKEND